MTDATGKQVYSSEYTPFGSTDSVDGTLDHVTQFTGKDLDEDTGLYYYNARWYDSDTGRFISEDSERDPNNPNLYTYCANDPLTKVDPTGNLSKNKTVDVDYGYAEQKKVGVMGKADKGDTFSSLAKDYYGDEKLGYIIAVANGLDPDSSLKKGQVIYVPIPTAIKDKAGKTTGYTYVSINDPKQSEKHNQAKRDALYNQYKSNQVIVGESNGNAGNDPLGNTAVAAVAYVSMNAGAIYETYTNVSISAYVKMTTAIGSLWQGIQKIFADESGRLGYEGEGKAASSIKVIGRLPDTAVAKTWAGHDVLNLNPSDWTIAKNDEWVLEGIKNNQVFYTASPINEENTWDFMAGRVTVYGREIKMLLEAGYVKLGDYFVPPTLK